MPNLEILINGITVVLSILYARKQNQKVKAYRQEERVYDIDLEVKEIPVCQNSLRASLLSYL